jgi:hypothetical protein
MSDITYLLFKCVYSCVSGRWSEPHNLNAVTLAGLIRIESQSNRQQNAGSE